MIFLMYLVLPPVSLLRANRVDSSRSSAPDFGRTITGKTSSYTLLAKAGTKIKYKKYDTMDDHTKGSGASIDGWSLLG